MTKKMTRYISVALATFIIGAGTTILWFTLHRPPIKKPEPLLTCYGDSTKAVDAEPPLAGSYFPSDIFSAKSEFEVVTEKRYSGTLAKMREPSFLSLPDCVEEAYRFFWIRTFDPYITVRVWQSQDERFLVAKEMNRDGKVTAQKFRRLTRDEWDKFKGLLEVASYWELPAFDNTFGGTDGAYWIMEGSKQKQYHLVDRWTQNNEEKYRASCIYLARLSGIEIKESDFRNY